MKPSELFEVAVRVIGLLLTLSALWTLLLGLLGFLSTRRTEHLGMILYAAPILLVAWEKGTSLIFTIKGSIIQRCPA
jgi:hypothetical protein